ncbi:MAG TPA: hypothetical protein VEG30_05715 [Terriglobales bacterium]|nr:hypothetical protein [Terriglobales bacterium]
MVVKSSVFLPACVLLLVMAGSVVPRVSAENQPHMRAALDALQTAKKELQEAEHDKGGHRAQALQLVDQAIQQVKMGINYGKKQEGKNQVEGGVQSGK